MTADTRVDGAVDAARRYGDNPFDVAHEMEMARSALLYADRVRLASWRVALMKSWEELRDARGRGDAERLLAALTAVEWARATPGLLEAPNAEIGALMAVPHDELTLGLVEEAVGTSIDSGVRLLEVAFEQPSWRVLNRAVAMGVVELEPLGDRTGYGFSAEAAVAEYLSLVAEHIGPSARAVPMMDFSAFGVFEVGIEVGVLVGDVPRGSREMGWSTSTLATCQRLARPTLT